VLCFGVAAPGAVAAPPPGLYGATGVLGPAAGSGDDRAPASNLYRINPDTGAATAVGSIGHPVTGLALDPTSGILYGVTATVESSGTPRSLLTLDSSTGAGTVVGSLGANEIDDIAFNASGELFGWNTSTNDLVRIIKATGVVIPVGDAGIAETHGGGLSFDRQGVLHALIDLDYGHLWRANTASGSVTQVARLSGSPSQTGGAGMNAAAFGCGGTTLYSVVNDFGDPPTYLVTVDTATGQIANKGVTVTALDALEWVCAGPAPSVPGAPRGARRCGNQILGTPASERIVGTAFGDLITGFGGRDVIHGLAGADCIHGKAGRDTVRGGTGVDSLEGGVGADRLIGGKGRGTLRGGPGPDRLKGGPRGDVVEGNNGRDRLSGAAGEDQLLGGHGGDRIVGGKGPDSIEAGRGADRVSVRDGRRDLVDCGFGRDTVVSRDSVDQLTSCERR
jgi:Ca2+-binding RTX toxin-like protein